MPLLLQRSWAVTSVIRNHDQVPTLKNLGENQSGKLDVLVRSLEDGKSNSETKPIIDDAKPDYDLLKKYLQILYQEIKMTSSGAPEKAGLNGFVLSLLSRG